MTKERKEEIKNLVYKLRNFPQQKVTYSSSPKFESEDYLLLIDELLESLEEIENQINQLYNDNENLTIQISSLYDLIGLKGILHNMILDIRNKSY